MRLLVFVTVIALFVPAGDDDDLCRRGHYYKDAEHGFELWIPAGLQKETKPKHEGHIRFWGSTPGLQQLSFVDLPVDNLEDYLAGNKRRLEENCPDSTVEEVGRFEPGGKPAVMLLAQKLDAYEPYRGTELLLVGVDLGETVVEVVGFVEKDEAQRKKAIKQMRWLLGTFRLSGEDGLNPYLEARRLHVTTGLSYRPPRGFKPEEASGVLKAVEETSGARIDIESDDGRDLRKTLAREVDGMKRGESSWSFPHDGSDWKVQGAVYASADGKAMALAFAEFAGAHAFTVRVTGKDEQREHLIRTTELVASALRYVDVNQARTEVAAALPILEDAAKKRKLDVVNAQVEVLAKHAFLAEARMAMARYLTVMDHAATQAKAIEALASAGEADVLPDLLKAVRYFDSRHKAELVEGTLKALGTVRDSKAISVLLKYAKDKNNAVAAAAVRSLGHYASDGKRILKSLVSLMVKEEEAGHKSSMPARERWAVLKPAYQQALSQLTGDAIKSGEEAEAWMKAHRL